MMHLSQIAAAALCLCALGAAHAEGDATEEVPAQEVGWQTSTSLETWAYGSHNALNTGSLLNPGNRIAQVPLTQWDLDTRFNWRATRGPVELVLAPRWLQEQDRIDLTGATTTTTNTSSLLLNQGVMRYKREGDTWAIGREVLTWGPANLRSPSNPFYFDSGRINPLASTPGVNLARGTVDFGQIKVTGAYVFSTNQIVPAEALGHTALVKMDQQGDNHLVSLIVSQQQAAAPFVGGFAQITPDDAWLVYGEFGSSRQQLALTPSTQPGPGPLFSVQQPAPRSHTALLGASYTLESGQVATAEYLHDGGGYSRAQEAQYFSQAQAANVMATGNPAAGYGQLGQALAEQPRLLGRDYLWLGWQSNPQDSKLYWRAGWTQNLHDGSAQTLVYVEKNFMPRLSGFVAFTYNSGSVSTDFATLERSHLTVGLKVFIF